MTKPEIKDNDAETITVEVNGAVKQSWVYANDDDRRDKMRRAWSWCDGYACASGAPLQHSGGVTLALAGAEA